jgi:hypothetical protein
MTEAITKTKLGSIHTVKATSVQIVHIGSIGRLSRYRSFLKRVDLESVITCHLRLLQRLSRERMWRKLLAWGASHHPDYLLQRQFSISPFLLENEIALLDGNRKNTQYVKFIGDGWRRTRELMTINQSEPSCFHIWPPTHEETPLFSQVKL